MTEIVPVRFMSTGLPGCGITDLLLLLKCECENSPRLVTYFMGLTLVLDGLELLIYFGLYLYAPLGSIALLRVLDFLARF